MSRFAIRTIVIGTLLSAACQEPAPTNPAADRAVQSSVVPPAPELPAAAPLPDETLEPTPPPTPPRDPLLAPTPLGTGTRAPGDAKEVNDRYAAPGDPISEMDTPRGNSISEMDAEKKRKDGEDPITREPPQPPAK